MPGRREARHVDADLRHDDVRRDVTHPRHRCQQGGARLDRLQRFSHSQVHLISGLLQGINEVEINAARQTHTVTGAGRIAVDEELDCSRLICAHKVDVAGVLQIVDFERSRWILFKSGRPRLEAPLGNFELLVQRNVRPRAAAGAA